MAFTDSEKAHNNKQTQNLESTAKGKCLYRTNGEKKSHLLQMLQ
jgi:hypothetical protein